MRKWILALLAALFLVSPVGAQEPIWLPLIMRTSCRGPAMSDWKVVVAEATTNTVLNPSAETTGNYTAEAGTTVTLSTTYAKWGLYSYRVETDADNEGLRLTTASLANAIHYATVRVRGTLPTAWDWSMDNSNWHTPTLIESLDADWNLYGVELPAAQCNGQTTFRIHQNGAGSGDFYVDAVQIEEKEYWTTYTDGDQPGCEWNGAEHASTSSRSAQSRAGGRVRDLQTDYSFDVGGVVGMGMAPQSLGVDEYALLPGGALGSVKINPRTFTLTGVVRGTSYADLHSKRQALVLLFSPDAVPEDADGPQPVRLRYTGAEVQKQIAAHYETGLTGTLSATGPCWWERIAVRFIADDPFWYEIGESAAVLDSNDSATFRIVAARLRSTGQWDNLGPPNAAGTYNNIEIIVEDDTYVYWGGSFQNFDNIPNANRVVRYEKATGIWSAMGAGLNADVYTMALAPNGDLYLGGNFTDVVGGPGGTYSYVVRWDGAAYNAVGAGMNNMVNGLAFDQNGDLYLVGNFTDVVGGPGGTYDYIARWDGAAYNAVGAGLNNQAEDLAVAPDNSIYVVGSFTDISGGPGGTYNYVIRWDGASYSALSTGLNTAGFDVAISTTGEVYVVGQFTTAGGVTVNKIARWNGTAWFALGDGLSGGNANAVAIGPDGIVYVVGTFLQAGELDIAVRAAKWNGSSWAHLDLRLPGSPTIRGLWTSPRDPVIRTNYDLWLGFTTTGTGYFAGSTMVTNDGTVVAFPKIVIERSGGTSATLETVRNETTGKELFYNYDLLNNEQLTTDLTPTEKSIVSNFFGDRLDAILAGCDFGTFALQPGSNQMTCFVNTAGGPTITAYALWRDTFLSYD